MLYVGADRKTLVVRVYPDRVAQLRGLDERSSAFLRRANRGAPAPPIWGAALLEPLQRRFTDDLPQRGIDVPAIDLRQAAEPVEQGLRIALQADTVHASTAFLKY